MKNSCEYYCLNIIVNISSFGSLNTNVNTTLKYYLACLKGETKTDGTVHEFLTKELMEHEMFDSMVA